MAAHISVRRYPRLVACLPVQCTTLNGERPARKVISGKTKSISAGGLGLLLPDTIALRTSVLVQVCQEEPQRGHVIWLDRPTPTDLGTRIPHGVAFDHPIDADLIRKWVREAKRQSHSRAPVRFDVEFTRERESRRGTCLNLSKSGMFIATTVPLPPGTEISLRFNLEDLADTVSIPAHVVWMRGGDMVGTHGEEAWPGIITGMGVEFLNPKPSQASLINSFLDRVCGEPPPSLVS